MTIIDDRTILDQNLGSAEQVVDNYVGKRPVFLIRVPNEYGPYQQRYDARGAAGRNGEPITRFATSRLAGLKPGRQERSRRPNL